MGFDPYNRPLNIQKSIGTPTPKMGVHLGVWGFIPSRSFALPDSLLAHNLTSPYFGREPKARVATMHNAFEYIFLFPHKFRNKCLGFIIEKILVTQWCLDRVQVASHLENKQ
jgi:hypothetical protein